MLIWIKNIGSSETGANICKMNAQMLLENVCIPLKNVSNFKIEYLKIDTIGKHLNDENFDEFFKNNFLIDKIIHRYV